MLSPGAYLGSVLSVQKPDRVRCFLGEWASHQFRFSLICSQQAWDISLHVKCGQENCSSHFHTWSLLLWWQLVNGAETTIPVMCHPTHISKQQIAFVSTYFSTLSLKNKSHMNWDLICAAAGSGLVATLQLCASSPPSTLHRQPTALRQVMSRTPSVRLHAPPWRCQVFSVIRHMQAEDENPRNSFMQIQMFSLHTAATAFRLMAVCTRSTPDTITTLFIKSSVHPMMHGN